MCNELTNSNSVCDKLEPLKVDISGVSYDRRIWNGVELAVFNFVMSIKLVEGWILSYARQINI